MSLSVLKMSIDELARLLPWDGDARAELVRRLRAGVAECERVMSERGANNATANRRIVASRIHEALTSAPEPAGDER